MKLNNKVTTEIRDYVMITIAMVCYCIGWTVFLLPNNITTGGVPGISSVLYWGTGIPVQTTYFIINAFLLALALKILGWRFCVKTIYAVIVLTGLTTLRAVMPVACTCSRTSPSWRASSAPSSVAAVWGWGWLSTAQRVARIS